MTDKYFSNIEKYLYVTLTITFNEKKINKIEVNNLNFVIFFH
jgi:hypothetical protein